MLSRARFCLYSTAPQAPVEAARRPGAEAGKLAQQDTCKGLGATITQQLLQHQQVRQLCHHSIWASTLCASQPNTTTAAILIRKLTDPLQQIERLIVPSAVCPCCSYHPHGLRVGYCCLRVRRCPAGCAHTCLHSRTLSITHTWCGKEQQVSLGWWLSATNTLRSCCPPPLLPAGPRDEVGGQIPGLTDHLSRFEGFWQYLKKRRRRRRCSLQ